MRCMKLMKRFRNSSAAMNKRLPDHREPPSAIAAWSAGEAATSMIGPVVIGSRRVPDCSSFLTWREAETGMLDNRIGAMNRGAPYSASSFVFSPAEIRHGMGDRRKIPTAGCQRAYVTVDTDIENRGLARCNGSFET